MDKIKVLTGKVLYGFIFIVLIPVLLVLWAKFTETLIALPVPEDVYYGYILFIAGLLICFSGMWHLWFFGKGLPMNAFPPEKFVSNGIYSIMKHPIYSGAVLISFGVSIISRSASGFWLVSPLFTLMIIAYVAGFENERTKTLFGTSDYKTFLSLPDADNRRPSGKEILSACLLVFVPWILVYEAFIYAGTPKDAIITNLPFERHLPVWEFSEIFYFFTYVLVLLIPLVIKTKEQLRRFITDMWFAIIVVGIFYFAFPFIVDQRDFTPHTFPGRFIIYERSMDGETGALPSFHVIWAFMAARYFTRSFAKYKLLWYSLAVLISVSCITTASHSIPDVIAGFCMFLIIVYRQQIWNYIRMQAEKLANSWREWRFGPVRLINHGFYGGAAGFTGMLLIGCFLGPRYAFIGFVIMIFVTVGAGLWAQIIEGSSKLLRPYGYYGGLIGGILTCIISSFIFRVDLSILLASCAMAGPWIQAIGRLRCLVQGCCHGRPSNEKIGIRFTHAYSRVNKISGLNGVPLHPTQLYSIGNNLVAGLILIRLYSLEMPAVFITGIYLILNGLGRFVEESFRGEAQTPYWAGIRIYQWIAVINIVAGAIITTIPHIKTLTFRFNAESVIFAIVIGLIVMIASGVDFPESNKRYARLTSL